MNVDAKGLETDLHIKFAAKRHFREWFELGETELIQAVKYGGIGWKWRIT